MVEKFFVLNKSCEIFPEQFIINESAVDIVAAKIPAIIILQIQKNLFFDEIFVRFTLNNFAK